MKGNGYDRGKRAAACASLAYKSVTPIFSYPAPHPRRGPRTRLSLRMHGTSAELTVGLFPIPRLTLQSHKKHKRIVVQRLSAPSTFSHTLPRTRQKGVAARHATACTPDQRREQRLRYSLLSTVPTSRRLCQSDATILRQNMDLWPEHYPLKIVSAHVFFAALAPTTAVSSAVSPRTKTGGCGRQKSNS